MAENLIPGQAQGDELGGGTTAAPATAADPWLRLAQDAYKRSTTYADNNYRKQWEDGIRLFNSQHPRDSKYNSDAYKYRSRVFRPKTRSVIRKHEATAAVALFSNPDVVQADPINPSDPVQAVAAKLNKELLQYRLTNSKKGIPWFITSIGAFQDAMTVGLCASFQYWDYQTETQKVKKAGSMEGYGEMEVEVEEEVPVVDKPCCELLSIQQIRFDPAAKWYDVVGTSPYVILERPMYLSDILDRMEKGYGKEGKPWKKLSRQRLLEARVSDDDLVQQARDGRREDPQQVRSTESDFDIIMVHLNFIRQGAKIYAFYSLKDLEVLTDPAPLKEMFPIGEIPVTVGFCLIETHQPMPKGLAALGSQLQQEANEIANQRLDNVKFVLNKRWIVRRGSQVDVEGILRNVPGGVTMASDVEKDVRELTWQDVTGSSFQEQDRLNADFDDLEGGGLNSSSVMTNRNLNETVGGMKMMTQGANMLTEYTFRVWVETWVEPTLRQIVKMEQIYESDETVLAVAAERAGARQELLQNPNLDHLLDQDLLVTVSVGMGATDPEARFQRFMQAVGAYTQISQMAPPDLNLPETRKELFGLAGFRDMQRFFTQVDPRLAQAQKMMQQAEQAALQLIDQHKDRIQRRERMLDVREQKLNDELNNARQEGMRKMQEAVLQFRLDEKKQEQDIILDRERAQQEFALEQEKHVLDMHLAAKKAQDEAAIKQFEARVDAAVKTFMAKTEQALAEAKKPKKRTAQKVNGKWQIEERAD